jgi:hypothetical protein
VFDEKLCGEVPERLSATEPSAGPRLVARFDEITGKTANAGPFVCLYRLIDLFPSDFPNEIVFSRAAASRVFDSFSR